MVTSVRSAKTLAWGVFYNQHKTRNTITQNSKRTRSSIANLHALFSKCMHSFISTTIIMRSTSSRTCEEGLHYWTTYKYRMNEVQYERHIRQPVLQLEFSTCLRYISILWSKKIWVLRLSAAYNLANSQMLSVIIPVSSSAVNDE